MKPSIIELQNFTKQYFPKDECPEIKYKEFNDSTGGVADTDNRIIYIKEKLGVDDGFKCEIYDEHQVFSTLLFFKEFGEELPQISKYYESENKFKLLDGEQYFLVLLHEIGHFMIELKDTKYHDLVKEFLRYHNELIDNFKTGTKPNPKVLNKFSVAFAEILNKYRGYKAKLHIEVDEWSRSEFSKKREEIRNILNSK